MKKQTYKTLRKQAGKKKVNKRLWLFLAVLALVVIVLGALELTDKTHLFHAQKAVSSTITTPTHHQSGSPTADKTDNGSTGNQPTNNTSSSNDAKGTGTTESSSGPLLAPYGNFVSNHKPGSNGSPSAETSVCITSPGATCYIKFTSADDPSIVKKLAAGTADANGAIYWDWDVKSAGFTNGTWSIEAIATQGTQTVTTKDTTNLEVSL